MSRLITFVKCHTERRIHTRNTYSPGRNNGVGTRDEQPICGGQFHMSGQDDPIRETNDLVTDSANDHSEITLR